MITQITTRLSFDATQGGRAVLGYTGIQAYAPDDASPLPFLQTQATVTDSIVATLYGSQTTARMRMRLVNTHPTRAVGVNLNTFTAPGSANAVIMPLLPAAIVDLALGVQANLPALAPLITEFQSACMVPTSDANNPVTVDIFLF